ncbi:hypothetical protein ARMGADRAFT_221593 [Armillaria gallica]|uniref:Uncharacterized protein n=1 Tax=Armillaria gallica TaxID=47427 RepID=A0A2H3EDA7_ARMGA|nr:hypothetical protein ARMGADRAFT_221593 [Armillaria gallica]
MKVAKVDDYKNVEAVAAVPKANRIEVVICALTWQSVEANYAERTALADAARAAGVKLFVPSEYVIGIGLSTARFFIGIFFSWIPGLSGCPSTGKINVVGTGWTQASWTATEDIGGTYSGEDPNADFNKV